MSDYMALYGAMLGHGQGQGGAFGGQGQGQGGVAPEANDPNADFVTEQSRSALTAGKILLKWQSPERGPSDRGQAREEYQQAMQDVRKGVGEAILKEQVPPGYHEAIKRYFQTIGKDGQDAAREDR